MRALIYVISAFLTGYVYSMAMTLLVVAGIEKLGSDPGSPGIMLFSLFCICGVASPVIASLMEVAKKKYQKAFPVKFSIPIFLLTFFPMHIFGLWFPDVQFGILEVPLATLFSIMSFFSYVPLYHLTAQGFINIHEFVYQQQKNGNRIPKYLVWASIIAVFVLIGLLKYFSSIPPSPKVMSLDKNWELVESGGRDWQIDAYPIRVTFDVNESLPYKISATYLSKSKPEEIYSIDIDECGKIYDKEIRESYPMRESVKLPINRRDWNIDSEKAWIMLVSRYPIIGTCANSQKKHYPIYIVLDHDVSGELEFVLYCSNCIEQDVTSRYGLEAKID